MNTKESILEQLKSSKFSDFAAGIENASIYFKETGYDERLFEHALKVFTYELDLKHEEIEKAYKTLGNNFQLFFMVLEATEEAQSNWFTKGQITGLSTFLTNFKEGKLDLSKYFMASGFVYQLVAQSCKNAIEIADEKEYAEERKGLELFFSVFDELWKLQMTVQGIIRATTNWDDFITVYLFNSALERADLEAQSRMMAGLSSHENNTAIQKDIVERYLENLDTKINRLKAQKDQVKGLKKTIIEWFPS